MNDGRVLIIMNLMKIIIKSINKKEKLIKKIWKESLKWKSMKPNIISDMKIKIPLT